MPNEVENLHSKHAGQIKKLEHKQRLKRELNDTLRKVQRSGYLVLTSGVKALGDAAVLEIRKAVANFNDFGEGNDPYGEHDFGALLYRGITIFWKIDCYDKTLSCGSRDSSDEMITTRVLTIMLAEEY